MDQNPKTIASAAILVLLGMTIVAVSFITPRWPLRGRPGSLPPDQHRGIIPEASCGPVGLSLVSRYLGHPISIEECHRATGAGEMGLCSMLDLVQAARTHSLFAQPVRMTPAKARALKYPMILHVEKSHFLVALPRDDGKLVVLDPPDEPVVKAWGDFSETWTGEAIVISNKEIIFK